MEGYFAKSTVCVLDEGDDFLYFGLMQFLREGVAELIYELSLVKIVFNVVIKICYFFFFLQFFFHIIMSGIIICILFHGD